jgi:hypothetical protein
MKSLLAALSVGLTMFFSGVLAFAQNTPPAGTIVVVKMADAVDSGSDPAGMQYHGSVTKPVDAANGINIAQGASAAVTLAKNGSVWTAQLSAVFINGRMMAVSSSSANVIGTAQGAAKAVNSVLGGFGHHANTPTALSAVASGQRVVLPPGTTLSFVLSAAAPAPPSPPSAATTPAVSTPVGAAAATSSGPTNPYHCISRGQKGNQPIIYSNQVIIVSAAESHNLLIAFQKYIQETYQTGDLQFGSDRCELVSAVPAQQAFTLSSEEKQWAASKAEVVHVQWTFTPGQAAYASAASPASASPTGSGGLYLYCFSDTDAPIIYFSDFFLAEPDPSGKRGVSFHSVQNAYVTFLKEKYAFNSGSNYPASCSNALNNSAGISYAQGKKQRMEDQYKQAKKQIVETGWKFTASQSVAEPATKAPARLHH